MTFLGVAQKDVLVASNIMESVYTVHVSFIFYNRLNQVWSIHSIKVSGYTSIFSAIFIKGNSFCGILFPSLADIALLEDPRQLSGLSVAY